MRRMIFALLVLTYSAFGQDWSTAKCRETFEARHGQLTTHFSSIKNTASEQFDSAVGKITTHDLLGWEQELEICINKIDGERTLYAVVSRQINEVINDRFLAYLVEMNQGTQFREWEEKKQRRTSAARQEPGR